jgi:DNA/RNA-binding domain of Phe-tRNA-synthetase-like protein
MSKKRFSTGNESLDRALHEEKIITARWYQAMCGQFPWRDGERENNTTKTRVVEQVIREEFAAQTADWFAQLPTERKS